VRAIALDQADPPAKGSGFTGRAGWANATVTLGANTWANRKILVTDDFREISKGMKQRVDGILGEDLLKEFHFVLIDFKHHRLVLRH
jgi:hypothetical protein